MRSCIGWFLTAAVTFCAPLSAGDFAQRIEPGIDAPQYLGLNETFMGRWPDGHVQWKYNPTDAPAPFDDEAYFRQLIEQAMAEWANVADVDFEFLGTDGAADLSNFDDDVVVIAWTSLPSGVGGLATASTGTATNADKIALGYLPYKDGNVRMNLNSDWDRGSTDFTERGVLQVLLHELGHLLGLGHSDNPESVMFADPYNNLTVTTSDDIAAVVGLYGPPEVTRLPSLWTAPSPGATSLIGDRWLTIDPQAFPPPEVTSIDDMETGQRVWVYWQHDSNAVDQIDWVLVDPLGFFHNGIVGSHTGGDACPPTFTCSKLLTVGRVDEMKTLPGTWLVQGIENGSLTVELPMQVDTDPVWNRPPPSTLSFDRTFGSAPLTVNATMDVMNDPEGDQVTVSWYVPGAGDSDDPLNASSGQSMKAMNFSQDGIYEVFATVDDDWVRYGVPGAGDAAGPGFRTVYRQVVKVGLDAFYGIAEVPDGDTDGVPELAVAIPSAVDKAALAYVKEPGSNQTSSSFGVLDGNWQVMKVESLDAGGTLAVAALAFDGLSIRVRVHAAATGNLLRSITFFDSSWDPVDMAVLPGSPADRVAVLARNHATGEIAAQIRDAATGAFVKNDFFLNSAWTPLEIEVVPDFDGNAGDELAVLGTNATGQIVASVKDAYSNAFIRNVFFLNANFRPVDLIAVSGLPGQSTPSLALLAQNRDTGLIVTMLKDAQSNTFIRNVFHLSNAFTPQAVVALAGIDGNPGPELAVLGVAGTGKPVVQIKDAGSNTFIRNLFPLGSAWEPRALRAIADIGGNGMQEVAVLARRKSDDIVVVQALDVSGVGSVNMFVP